MKKNFLLVSLLTTVMVVIVFSCSSNDDYQDVPDLESPVVLDLAQVPYATLSEYKFFEGDIKNQEPSLGVLPYEPISSLFTDYALKKRFVWMPKNTKATYSSDGEILDFPTGSVLIKNFYYDNVQPGNGRRIIETRLLVKKESGWIFAEYVWNADQTEASLQMEGSYTPVSWKDEAGITQNVNYRIPSEVECLICHKSLQTAIPIGPKPQNLNSLYTFKEGSKNQLSKWIEMGYLDASIPSNIATVVNYKDASKPLDLRVRSYIDINCAHCHQQNSHCDYRPMRFAFSESSNPVNMGICVPPDENINDIMSFIVTPNNIERSVLHFRMNTTDEALRMPIVGRSVIHKEGVELIEQWIETLNPCN
ncbi:hypothetical protein [Flavobacterium orientale]|nr:hypothetical protein [Flavobacterium orientale]